MNIKETYEYKLSKACLLYKKAKRTKVSYFTHVEEGLIVLDNVKKLKLIEHYSLIHTSKLAFCLHPLIQDDKDLDSNFLLLIKSDPLAVGLAFEYRNIANLGSRKNFILNNNFKLSILPEVNAMLIADKVQNYFSFLKYKNIFSKEDSNNLDLYFKQWFNTLNISKTVYGKLLNGLN